MGIGDDTAYKDIYQDTQDVVMHEVLLKRQEVKDAYDELESISAKVKMWIKINKVHLIVDAGILLAGIILGALI